VADLRNKYIHNSNEENYLDWYCSGCEGTVDHEIEDILKEYGWTPEIL
jgi:hypothetical protein